MTEPHTMTAVEIIAPGGPDMLAPRQVPVPWPRPGEVRIRVAAAGVNRPDILQRMGGYPPPPDASPLPGLEVAGTVDAVGREVEGWSEGDEVVALTNGGGYAEYATAPASQVLPLPAGHTPVEGAALPETLFTVQQTLIDRAGLGAGQAVLVHGGAGGIGAAAIQLARLAGAVPYATVSAPDKADYARALGAEAAIDYLREDFVDRVRDLTGGRGVDMVLDIVGGDYVTRNLRALAQGGTIIQLALLGGRDADVDMSLVLRKHATIFGSTLRPQPPEVKAAIARNLLAQVWPALADGRIGKPRLRTFPLAAAADAHRAMEAGDHFGKIVLVTDFGAE